MLPLGQRKGLCYWPSFKLELVKEKEAGMHPDGVLQNFSVNRLNAKMWVENKEKLIDATKSEQNNHFEITRATKYVNLYKTFEKGFREADRRTII